MLKSDLDRAIEESGVGEVDYIKKHELGSRCILPNGWAFQYGKVDFGIVAKDNDGGEIRNIQYRWINVPL